MKATQGIELYQQPAGFEDSIITAWEIQKQSECDVSMKEIEARKTLYRQPHNFSDLNDLPV